MTSINSDKTSSNVNIIDNSKSESFLVESGDKAKPESLSVLEPFSERANAVSSLFINSVTTSHFYKPLNDSAVEYERSCFSSFLKERDIELSHLIDDLDISFFNKLKSDLVFRALYEKGMPLTSLTSMLACGMEQACVVASCGCGERRVPIAHRCSLRNCQYCSQTRKRRIFRKEFPFLKSLHVSQKDQLTFWTFAPEHYPTLEEGLEFVPKGFAKLLRHKYVKIRVKGGLYVIEVKNKNPDGECKGWHVHLHSILYGARLDNQIRGKCNECRQNLLKYNKEGKFYYCASFKCKSREVIKKGDSKIVRASKKAWGRNVMVDARAICDGRRSGSAKNVLNYFLKYISINKDDFMNELDCAEYIIKTRKKRLISCFGVFFKRTYLKMPCLCLKCNQPIIYRFEDGTIIKLLIFDSKPAPPINPHKEERRNYDNNRMQVQKMF